MFYIKKWGAQRGSQVAEQEATGPPNLAQFHSICGHLPSVDSPGLQIQARRDLPRGLLGAALFLGDSPGFVSEWLPRLGSWGTGAPCQDAYWPCHQRDVNLELHGFDSLLSFIVTVL